MKRPSTMMRCAMVAALPALLGSGIVAAPASALPALAGPATDTGAPIPALDFQPCGDAGAVCSTAVVPLDYDDPNGDTVSLFVAKAPATDQANRIGTVFLNTGGPGGDSGGAILAGAASVFPEAVRQRFDIVGFDPRGVGNSTPIRCFASADEQAAVLGAAPAIPVNADEVAALKEVSRRYGEFCAANAGPLLSHMSTANVARDMDVLRAAVGDEQLTYVGLSYGTHLGTVYSNLFPDRVRAVALDANLDAVGWTTGRRGQARRTPFDTRIQSATGAAATLDGFLSECVRAGADRCALAADGDPFEKWEELLARLRTAPIEIPQPDGSVAVITYSSLVGGVFQALYGPPSTWAGIAAAVQDVYANVNVPAAMEQLERAALEARTVSGYAEGDPFDDSFSSVTCSETDNPTNQAAWERNARREARRFGAAGDFWAWGSLPCATWPVKDEDRYAGPWDNETANPILLINNFFDPATSFESAVELQSQLANAQLLPVAGYGHVAFPDSACASDALATYLIHQQLPAAELVCFQDSQPFVTPPAQQPQTQNDPSVDDSLELELLPSW
jgi:pimeloyl-ACP methyl ester carboxylesterase